MILQLTQPVLAPEIEPVGKLAARLVAGARVGTAVYAQARIDVESTVVLGLNQLGRNPPLPLQARLAWVVIIFRTQRNPYLIDVAAPGDADDARLKK
jgi:hypothetical protein